MTYPVGGHWAARVLVAGDPLEVLSIAELQERARIVAGDAESDELLTSYIAAAIDQVERDTGLALPTQTIAVTFDEPGQSGVLLLPRPPCQEVIAIAYMDSAGTIVQPDPGDVVLQLDTVSMPARLTWMPGTFVGAPAPLAALQLSVLCGYTPETLPPSLKFAVGLLATHYLTAGRDRVVIGTSVLEMPAGYAEAIEVHRLEIVT